MLARPPLRNINDMVLALLLLLAGVGPGGLGPGGLGPGGVRGQLAAKPTRGPHPSSPCPSVFSYEGREPEKNRWYGVILVTTEETLDGLRLSVRLTHRAQILGNFLGDVSTTDNVEFTILNLKTRLTPGPPMPVRIFAAFGDRDDIPYIANIKLNGRTICGSNNPDLGLDTGSRPGNAGTPSRSNKPTSGRPAGVGGAGGGVSGGSGGGGGSGGSAGIAASHQYEEETRPRPPPPTPATARPTQPPPRSTPAPTPRPTPAYEPPPGANPDNYYPSSNSVNSNEASQGYGGNTRPHADDGYRNNFTSPTDAGRGGYKQRRPSGEDSSRTQSTASTASTEADRGVYHQTGGAPDADRDRGIYRAPATTDRPREVYRPPSTTERYQPPSSERPDPGPVYTPKYAPAATERPAPVYTPKYGGGRTTTTEEVLDTPRTTPSRPGSSVVDRDRRPVQPAPDVDMSPPPQPWPTSNYDEPAPSRPAPDRNSPDRNAPDRNTPDRNAPDAAPGRPRPARSTCGTIAPPATPLIINGETSIPGKWPWHVALYKPHGRDWKYQCGGSLISPTVVVTAAHCVTTTVGRPVGPESLLVFLGKHALRTTSEDGVQDKHVYFIHVHPGYNYTNYRNDIAVLILSSPATITSAVRPVCLWDKGRTDLSHVEGKFGTVVGWRTDLAQPETDSDKVVGWGIETDGLLTEELHQALMPVVSPAICVYSYPAFFGVYTNNQTYCAGYSPDQPAAGTSVCNGDSGGGMFFKRDEEVPDDEAVWMLRGLVSLSVRTKQDRCDPSHFVVFTDVAKYVDWLENFLVP